MYFQDILITSQFVKGWDIFKINLVLPFPQQKDLFILRHLDNPADRGV